jgi:uncharacterized protein YjbI with pentapeptide repeats
MVVRIIDDPLYQLLRSEKIEEFNRQRSSIATIDFTDCDFRGLDLRKIDARGVNFSGAYFRGADLRGVDFSESNLQGASLAGAQISGCLFPLELTAAEIELSVSRGTRMRYTKPN